MEIIFITLLTNMIKPILFISFFLTSLMLFLAKNLFFKIGFMDIPNSRSSHKVPVALGGGIIIIPTIVFLGFFLDISFNYINYITIITLFSISFMDDLRNINAIVRLFFHIISVFLFTHYYLMEKIEVIFPNLESGLIFLIYISSILGITWFINSFNFMDGIDGITSIQVIYTICSLILLETFLKSSPTQYYLVILGSIISFLIFNWSPAKIFLGDSGSIPLGFLMVHFLVEFSLKGYWVSALILPMYYLLDTTLTLLKRGLKRKKIWQSHNEHYYQLAVKSGKSHSAVCLYIIIVSTGLFLLSFLSVLYKNNLLFLLLSIFWCYLFIIFFSRFKNAKIQNE